MRSKFDYQWSPTRQQTILEDRHEFRDQFSPVQGFTIDGDGDWLLLTPGISQDDYNRKLLWRSHNKGNDWIQQRADIPLLDDHDGFNYSCLFPLVTRSGRILVTCVRSPWNYGSLPHRLQKPFTRENRELGCLREDPPGRFTYAKPGFLHTNCRMYVASSDDGGRTWQSTDFLDVLPLHSPQPGGCGNMVEAPDGTIILPFYGSLEEGIAYGWKLCSCYVASSDGGKTWGRPVVVARGDDERGQWYGEIAVLPRRGHPWLAMVRMNPMFRLQKPSGHGMLSGYRCWSHDQGQTWTVPEPVNHVVAYPVLLELTDGSLLFGASHWQACYLYVSTDDGQSIAYGMQVPHSGGDILCLMQPDEGVVVIAHKDITHQKILLTRLTRQPTTQTVVSRPPQHPPDRWVIRDLENIHADPDLKPYCSSAKLVDGTIAVAGCTGGTDPGAFVLISGDHGRSWSARQVVCRPRTFAAVSPAAMTTIGDQILMIVCNESDRFEQHDSSTSVRTFISTDRGVKWDEVTSNATIDGIGAIRPGSTITDDGQGNLVLPVCGNDDTVMSVCGTLRSEDLRGGWRSFRPIHRAIKPGDNLGPPAVAVLRDGRWLAVFTANLSEYRTAYRNGRGTTYRQAPLWQATSIDEGLTWSEPAQIWSAHRPGLLNLPDGGLMLTSLLASTMRYQISYNDGASWSFENCVISYPMHHFHAGVFAMSNLSVVVLDDRTLLGTYFCNDDHEGGPRLVTTWIRALPAESPESRERGL